MDTVIITPMSAASGMMLSSPLPKPSTAMSMTPATSVLRRPRPPDLTLTMACPIMAQPGMPPMQPHTILVMP